MSNTKPTVKTSLSIESALKQRADGRAKRLKRNFSNYVQFLIEQDLAIATAQRGASKA